MLVRVAVRGLRRRRSPRRRGRGLFRVRALLEAVVRAQAEPEPGDREAEAHAGLELRNGLVADGELRDRDVREDTVTATTGEEHRRNYFVTQSGLAVVTRVNSLCENPVSPDFRSSPELPLSDQRRQS